MRYQSARNTRGTVPLPGAALAQVSEGERGVESVPGVTRAVQEDQDVVVGVGSGSYRFSYDTTKRPGEPPPGTPIQR